MARRILWLIDNIHWIWVAAALAYAVTLLALLPNVERAMLLWFVPPLLACFLLALNKINRTNPEVICLCKVFLSMVAVAVLLGEQRVLFANLKPQFPGMPAQQDRILTFYFMAYALFLWVLLPGYLLGNSNYLHYHRRPAPISLPTCCIGTATWLGVMALLAALTPRIIDKLF